MVQCRRLCGFAARSVGLLAVLLYLVDISLAALDGYVPGEDYPVYSEVPKGLSFTCDDKLPGYYADPETQCQAWHWCVPGISGNVMYSFLCGPGTVFNQRTRVCDWFFKVDCPNAQAYYGINEDLYKDDAGNYIAGKKFNCMDVAPHGWTGSVLKRSGGLSTPPDSGLKRSERLTLASTTAVFYRLYSNWDKRRLMARQRRLQRQDSSDLVTEPLTNDTSTDKTKPKRPKTRITRRTDKGLSNYYRYV